MIDNFFHFQAQLFALWRSTGTEAERVQAIMAAAPNDNTLLLPYSVMQYIEIAWYEQGPPITIVSYFVISLMSTPGTEGMI